MLKYILGPPLALARYANSPLTNLIRGGTTKPPRRSSAYIASPICSTQHRKNAVLRILTGYLSLEMLVQVLPCSCHVLNTSCIYVVTILCIGIPRRGDKSSVKDQSAAIADRLCFPCKHKHILNLAAALVLLCDAIRCRR